MSNRSELKDALFARLLDVVQNGVEIMTDNGPARVTAPAPYLQAAIGLLKVEEDAGTPVPQNAAEVLRRLQKKSPFAFTSGNTGPN